ncbi:MAG: DeoR/GlpR transcriptional regulator [Sedimentisphaerales bacterium]|nr:DeoR/GlpR transcriptional regulator [Sedimentisphaerales bacterium]
MRKRQQQIVKYINEHALAGVEELAELFGVSVMTIRRDIEYLASMSLVQKVTGGAQVLDKPSVVHEAEVSARINFNLEKKQRICGLAYSLIKQGQSVFIGASTTLLPLAKLIAANNPRITVVTNSVLACIDLVTASKVEVISVGGRLDRDAFCFVGANAAGWTDSFSFDIAFFASTAFYPQEGTYESSLALLDLKQTIAARSNKVVYLGTSDKFGNRGLVKVLDTSVLDVVVTDDDIAEAHVQFLKEKNVEVMIA